MARIHISETRRNAMDSDIENARRQAAVSPLAWFIVLERARETRDYERAAEAIRQLRKLGVTVKFHRRPKAGDHA